MVRTFKSVAPKVDPILSDAEKYNWAQALFKLASVGSSDPHLLVEATGLDPKSGDLSDIDLRNLDLSEQDFSGWDLRCALLEDANLANTNLRGAKIDPYEVAKSKNWSSAKLSRTDRRYVAMAAKLATSTEELALSVRSANVLKLQGINTIFDLVQTREAELLRSNNFGRKSLNEIKEVLYSIGLSFGMKIPQRLLTMTRRIGK
jgi:hypothetical protein